VTVGIEGMERKVNQFFVEPEALDRLADTMERESWTRLGIVADMAHLATFTEPVAAFGTLRRVIHVHLSDGGHFENMGLYELIRRRARQAGIRTPIGCHSFRATGITIYLQNGGTLEKAQQMAAHESPRTTKLYDRTTDAVSLDEVERVVF
jgi:site-specific recombinase XerD